jgi:uncharacterized protein involved in cysteine biosynthesis
MGTIVSVMFLVPVANLIAPVIGTAMAIHLFDRSKQIPIRSSSPQTHRD